MGKRRKAREMATQMLYQREMGGSSLPQIFAAFDVGDYRRETEGPRGASAGDRPPRKAPDPAAQAELDASFAYARQLVTGTTEHAEAIDALIRRHAENWRLERMPTIDRNILRLAIYEMLYEDGVPKVVIVDEAIELAKKFGAEQSGRFVNGLLDGVLKADENFHRSSGRAA